MKTKVLTAVCAVALLMSGTSQTLAQDDPGVLMLADIVVVRPACLVATIVGSAFFVVSLPMSAMAGSVKQAKHILVCAPARAAFTRPLGDMDALPGYYY
jgi:hypothetical protein